METRLLLLLATTVTYSSQSQSQSQFRNYSWPLSRNPGSYISLRSPNLCSRIRRIYTPRYSRWDANAESVRTQRFNSNFLNKDDQDSEENDMDQGPGILDEFIDSVYIFKVFKSFGWLFPPFILSMLAATGPKAFLISLALPLGQSALSLAFKKLFGRKQNQPKRKSRIKKKPSAKRASSIDMEEEKEEEIPLRKTGYQSWVGSEDGSANKGGGQNDASFGGWDELDKQGEYFSKERPSRPEKGSRLSRRGRKTNAPLLLRLLIALFPFLGSWAKWL